METNSYIRVGMADSAKPIEKRGSVLNNRALAEPAIVSTVALWRNGWVVTSSIPVYVINYIIAFVILSWGNTHIKLT